MNKKVLIITLSDPSTDPRPYRMINYFNRKNYLIDLMSFKIKDNANIRFNELIEIELKFNIINKFKRLLYKVLQKIILIENFKGYLDLLNHGIDNKIVRKLKNKLYDIIVIEDIHLLPLLIVLKMKSKIIFDMREFYEEQSEGELIFQLFIKKRRIEILKKYLKKCNLLFTVSENIKKLYEEKYKVKVNLIRSLPYYHDIKVRKTDKENIKIIYFGAAKRNRKIENLIYLSNKIDRRFSLYLILVGNEKYKSELKEKAKNNNRIIFKEPVEFKNLIYEINNYDMSFCYFEPTTKNLLYTLPNKFFESIMARVPLIIGPSPEMVPYVKEYSCGLYIDEFNIELLAKKINELTNEDIDKMKENCDKISKKLCWEEEEKVLDNLFSKYIGE